MQISIDRADVTRIAETLAGIMLPAIQELVANMIVNGAVVAATHSPILVCDEDMLDQALVAKMIGMSTAWLEKKRCVGGGIPFRKIGGSVRYMRKDVNNYIHRRTFGNTCEANFYQV